MLLKGKVLFQNQTSDSLSISDFTFTFIVITTANATSRYSPIFPTDTTLLDLFPVILNFNQLSSSSKKSVSIFLIS